MATLTAPTASDYLELASWIADAEQARRWAGPNLPYPFTADSLEALLALPGINVSSFCLVDARGMCGFGQFWQPLPAAVSASAAIENSVHLGRIIISPHQRGRGLGRALIEQLITKAIEVTAASAITLRVYRSNLAAATLYSQLGFVAVDALSNEELLFMVLRR
ncbi:GNAT family N-acetyltransferase [Shewanella sp. 3B26]|uniref:GNAT family N-acetyltransferase n=1 Tax=Shewanella zhuhaiensis TaxID=2919576 RepID=A0AAJ1EYF1_9GAMM|nr:GNAT family N-acetyltransferase [Shewanella zhuhaiensis]MCH4295039.1 GNAT family N-acetyltransferase [Shewanella zhuhaiensis]